MANYTKNYNFKKPEPREPVLVEDINRNFDITDAKLHDVSEKLDSFASQSIAIDGLHFDEANSMLYLSKAGENVSAGVKITGTAGSSTQNNAILTLANTSGWIYQSIATNSEVIITLNWTSIEDSHPTGDGIARITINKIQKLIQTVNQGIITLDITKYLQNGTNHIGINVQDKYGNNRTIFFTVIVSPLIITSSFDDSIAYTDAIRFNYNISGAGNKTVHFILDDQEIATKETQLSNRQDTYVIPKQSHGAHHFEVYFTSSINDQITESNHLFYDIIFLQEGNNQPIISSSFHKKTIGVIDSISIKYFVYSPDSIKTDIKLYENNTTINTLSVDRSEQTWNYTPSMTEESTLKLTIEASGIRKTFSLALIPSPIKNLTVDKTGLELRLDAINRSNSEVTPSKWTSGTIASTLTNFNFTNDGWLTDAMGANCLHVRGNARVQIPFKIFGKDIRTSGKTIELEFMTGDITMSDATLLTCLNDGRGIILKPSALILTSELTTLNVPFKPNEHLRLSIVIESTTENRLIHCFINGIESAAIEYPANDDFQQHVPKDITIGSNDASITLYSIEIYDTALTRYQILDNFIASASNISERIKRYKRNNIFDETGSIDINKLPINLPYMIISGDGTHNLPYQKNIYEGTSIVFSGSFIHPLDFSRSFTFKDAYIDKTDNSSQSYTIKFYGGFRTFDGALKEKYAWSDNAIESSRFVLEANNKSSDGANNIVLSKLFNDINPTKTPPMKTNSSARWSNDGIPIILFFNDGKKTTFMGKYNLTYDNDAKDPYGFEKVDQSWHILNSDSIRVLGKNDDFLGDSWLNDFHSRYPDRYSSGDKLKQLITWLKSTDTILSTNTQLAAPATINGSTYTSDTPAYRLAKFKNEFDQHFDKTSTLFYYLFTEFFLLVDARILNACPTLFHQTGKWYILPNLLTSALGANEDGLLAISYSLEDTDYTNTNAPIFKGQEAVLWINIRKAFANELRTMYQSLRTTGALSLSKIEKYFNEHQDCWPEAIFNEDTVIKYLKDHKFLPLLNGSKKEQRQYWLANRITYLDSKYDAGTLEASTITFTAYAKSSLKITTSSSFYIKADYGNKSIKKRAIANKAMTLPCPLETLNETTCTVHTAPFIADLGDLSSFKIGWIDLSNAASLQHIKLGSNESGYTNPNLGSQTISSNIGHILDFTNCHLLKTIDARNCTSLAQPINLSKCHGIEEAYFDNTKITSITLPNGGVLRSLHLPSTLTSLTIRNQQYLNDYQVSGYSHISTLIIENNSPAINPLAILASLPDYTRLRLIGFTLETSSAADIETFIARLDKMKGIDEQGHNTDHAQVSGTIILHASISGDMIERFSIRYPTITLQADHITTTLTFRNSDGTLIARQTINDGGNGTYITASKAPTKQSTYNFIGWSKYNNNIVDPSALESITKNRTVYACYQSSLRYYTVRFYNGGTLLESTSVSYGLDASYHGAVPTYNGNEGTPSGWRFLGWNPEPKNIQSDTDCFAFYQDISSITRQLIARDTIMTDLTSSAITKVGSHAFEGCPSLKIIDLPQCTSINGQGAFANCTSLKALVLRNKQGVCMIENLLSSFTNTPIEKGNGFIYVPSSLLDAYRTSSSWSALKDQIRAIETYTSDHTVNGSLTI